jgi:hypothetical protein
MLDSGFDQLVQPNDNVGVEESFSWFQVAGLFRERDRLKKGRHQKLWIGGCPRRMVLDVRIDRLGREHCLTTLLIRVN